MKHFSPATRRWFTQHFDGPTDAQRRGWPVIASGQHCLITAPTGSGKTLAAFLWAIDRLLVDAEARDAAPPGTRVLYLSPLKALVVDIERNLRAPLAGITQAAATLGIGSQTAALRPPEVAIRTGDTPARERQRQLKTPAEILVTTPESLYLILGSQAAATLSQVETVIVDEVHALAPTKRGAHLALSLERLSMLVTQAGNPEPQRIGLSATVQPLAEAARWLGGDRIVEIVDAAAPPRLDLRVSVPVPDMERPPQPSVDVRPGQPHKRTPAAIEPEGGPILGELFAREQQHPSENRQAEKGLWSAIYPALLAEIMAHRSTIVFVNSRGLCERLSQRLNALAAEPEVDDGRVGCEDLAKTRASIRCTRRTMILTSERFRGQGASLWINALSTRRVGWRATRLVSADRMDREQPRGVEAAGTGLMGSRSQPRRCPSWCALTMAASAISSAARSKRASSAAA